MYNWNHALALSKRYYKLTGKTIHFNALKKHIAKLRKRVYTFWQKLGSQAALNIKRVGASTHSLEVVRREEGDSPDFRSLA